MKLEDLLADNIPEQLEEELQVLEKESLESMSIIDKLMDAKNTVSTEGMSQGLANQLTQIDSEIHIKDPRSYTLKPSSLFAVPSQESIGAGIMKWIKIFIENFCNYSLKFWDWIMALKDRIKSTEAEYRRQNDFNKKVVKNIKHLEVEIGNKIADDEVEFADPQAFYDILKDKPKTLAEYRKALDDSITKLVWSFSVEKTAHVKLQEYSMFVQRADKMMTRALGNIEEIVDGFKTGDIYIANKNTVLQAREQVMVSYTEFSKWQQRISMLKIGDVKIEASRKGAAQALLDFYPRLFKHIRDTSKEPSGKTYNDVLKRGEFNADLELIQKVTSKTMDHIILRENYNQITKNIRKIRELKKVLGETGFDMSEDSPERTLVSVLTGLQHVMLTSGKLRNIYRIYPNSVLKYMMCENRYLQEKRKLLAELDKR